MHINYIGYNHCHDADFQIQRPTGSGDYLMLLLKTPAIFTLNGEDIITSPDSFMLYREGTPQMYRAYDAQFSNDWFHFSISDEEMRFLKCWTFPLIQ